MTETNEKIAAEMEVWVVHDDDTLTYVAVCASEGMARAYDRDGARHPAG